MSDPIVSAKNNSVPNRNSKSYRLLDLLLKGMTVDPQVAYMQLNLPTVQARISELRRIGWPIRSLDIPHPVLERERVKAYVLDTHFRAWMTDNPGRHPAEYPFKDGRGKFADLDAAAFKAGIPQGKGKPAMLVKDDE